MISKLAGVALKAYDTKYFIVRIGSLGYIASIWPSGTVKHTHSAVSAGRIKRKDVMGVAERLSEIYEPDEIRFVGVAYKPDLKRGGGFIV